MRALVLVLLGACGSPYQSARVLDPGKTQVTASVTRVEVEDDDDHVNIGDLQVRHGVGGKVDVGVRLSRTPGALEGVAGLGGDVKVQVTEPGAKATLSFALPVGVAWEEEGTDFGNGLLMFGPTAFVGIELSPTVELVIAPRIVWVLPDASTEDAEIEFAASLGLRFTDATRAWAVHPELGFVRFADDTDNLTFLTFGVGVAVGN